MGLLLPSGARIRSASTRASWAAAVLLAIFTTTACAPEVESVPAESVTSAESAESAGADASDASDAAAPTGKPARKPAPRARRKATHPGQSGTAGDDAGSAGPQRVRAGRVSFAAPAGWEALDAQTITRGVKGTSLLRDIAERMGVSAEQLVATLGAAELLLFSDTGAHRGFLDNLNVVTIPGPVPGDEQLRQQFLAVGAGIHGIEHTGTALGDVVSLAYDLDLGGFAVAGEIMMVEVGGETVAVTVSALDRDTTRKVAGLVRDTLAAAR